MTLFDWFRCFCFRTPQLAGRDPPIAMPRVPRRCARASCAAHGRSPGDLIDLAVVVIGEQQSERATRRAARWSLFAAHVFLI